jgi:hypothetical protein
MNKIPSPLDVTALMKESAAGVALDPGADHSLKEYFYVLQDTFVKRYRTDPYVSLASGNLCLTLSGLFRDGRSDIRVLCADLALE